MPHEEQQARALGATTASVAIDTGLTDAEQHDRDVLVAQWIGRIRQVMDETGCSAAVAARAIEASDAEQRRSGGHHG